MGRKQSVEPKDTPISVYLGPAGKKVERMQRLDEMAAKRGISRSLLIQLIADGTIPLGDTEDGQPPKYTFVLERQPA